MFSCDNKLVSTRYYFSKDKAITINTHDYDNIANYIGSRTGENYNKPQEGQNKAPKDMDDAAILKHQSKHNYLL